MKKGDAGSAAGLVVIAAILLLLVIHGLGWSGWLQAAVVIVGGLAAWVLAWL